MQTFSQVAGIQSSIDDDFAKVSPDFIFKSIKRAGPITFQFNINQNILNQYANALVIMNIPVELYFYFLPERSSGNIFFTLYFFVSGNKVQINVLDYGYDGEFYQGLIRDKILAKLSGPASSLQTGFNTQLLPVFFPQKYKNVYILPWMPNASIVNSFTNYQSPTTNNDVVIIAC